MNHAAIIQHLGDCKAVAEALGEKPNTVSHWKQRRIPADRWLDIVELAAEKGVRDITLELLRGRSVPQAAA